MESNQPELRSSRRTVGYPMKPMLIEAIKGEVPEFVQRTVVPWE